MPLIIFTGGPCSGKTKSAEKLTQYLTEKGEDVKLINEESLGLNKIDYYTNFQTEKNLRAKLKSEVEKNLNDKRVVILDYLNYVKGYRYELYCLVRNLKTRQCVVYFKIDIDTCIEYNEKDKLYSNDLLKDLYQRMEEPIAKNRWDSPLLTVFKDEELPYEEIYTILNNGKRPNYAISTNTEISVSSSFLQDIEDVCKDINNQIISQQANGLSNCLKIDQYELYLKKIFSGNELKNIKQEFVKLCKMHPPKNKDLMKKSFIEYINTVQDRFI